MIDTLISKIESLNAPIVVGLDPTLEMLPAGIIEAAKKEYSDPLKAIAEALLTFNQIIIDAIHELVPAVKPQIAMYERFGPEGIRAYAETAKYAKSKGLLVIGDIKRGDIASTAEAYACHIGGVELDGTRFFPWQEDAVTISPYLGGDSITPFTDICKQQDKGIFVLVKTSNKGSGDLQDVKLNSGLAVYEHMADLVSGWGKDLIGKSGYSKVGAVVGATFPQQGRELRKRMPHTFFLVPGYGAQGGAGKDLQGFFDADNRGCIVNSSRGIIAAWQKDPKYGENNIGDAARDAVITMREDLREAYL